MPHLTSSVPQGSGGFHHISHLTPKSDDDQSGPGGLDGLMAAAGEADLYLGEHPALAAMPLGQVVETLVDGVRSTAGASPLDVDLQTLAKRVGHFVHNHPRLANSEFGQIVSYLVRDILAFDGSVPPNADPPVPGDRAAQAEAASVVTPNDVTTEAEEARAAA